MISFNEFSELLLACTCARAIGNLWNISLGINILSLVPLVALSFASSLQAFSSSLLSTSLLNIDFCFYLYH